MGIGNRLRAIRIEHDMSQKDLAKRLNVSYQGISSWERDRTEPNTGMIKKLCDIFNCSVIDLMGEEETEKLTTSTKSEYEFLKRYRYADFETRCVVERILSTVDVDRVERLISYSDRLKGDDVSDN